MNIINKSNAEIPAWVMEMIKSAIRFHGNLPIIIAPIQPESPSRYSGVSIGTNILITEFGDMGCVTYTVKMQKN